MEYSPQWQIATHIHWTKGVVDLADGYLMRLFKASSPEVIPSVRLGSLPYQVSNIRHVQFTCVHARRGDFKEQCENVPLNECFASLSVMNRRVNEVQDELAVKFPGMGGVGRSLR